MLQVYLCTRVMNVMLFVSSHTRSNSCPDQACTSHPRASTTHVDSRNKKGRLISSALIDFNV